MTPITYAVPIVIGRERDVTGTWSALAEPRRTADTKSFCIGENSEIARFLWNMCDSHAKMSNLDFEVLKREEKV